MIRGCYGRATLDQDLAMTDLHASLTASGIGTIISVEVTPGSKSPAFPSGYNPWRHAVGCSVRARASGGEANREVIEVVAAFFGIEEQRVRILSGHRSHMKRISLAGLGAEQAEDLLLSSFPDREQST